MSTFPLALRRPRAPITLVAAGLATAALAATAAWVRHKARRGETAHPPRGRFVSVDGTRLHYLDRGVGSPVVLLHGNVVHAEDFVVSGLVDRIAQQHRVIAFDRPGFGYSERPRGRLWTAAAQARLVHRALEQLGVEEAVVLGHSWGALVALALAQRAPAVVRKLVLVSGYYFPTVRPDVVIAAPPAIPLVGDVLRYTVSPVMARSMLNKSVKGMFAPQSVPSEFLPTLSREMLVRPSQIRAHAQDAALMIPSAASLRKQYTAMSVPTTIFAGDADPVVNPEAHARKLHAELPNSQLHLLPGVGHMAHHAAPDRIAAAVMDQGRAMMLSGAVLTTLT